MVCAIRYLLSALPEARAQVPAGPLYGHCRVRKDSIIPGRTQACSSFVAENQATYSRTMRKAGNRAAWRGARWHGVRPGGVEPTGRCGPRVDRGRPVPYYARRSGHGPSRGRPMEADGVWWLPRSSKPLAAPGAVVGSIPASSGMTIQERLSGIPQLERLLSDVEISEFFGRVSRPLALRAVSEALTAERERALQDPGYLTDHTICRAAALSALRALDRKRVRKVLNGTGIILNTNLGRAPLPASAWDDARDANLGYTPIELDLESGGRGRRGGLCHELAAALAGAEAALVVNNNAAGVLLALSALAPGREVVVARGEQVQIGGGFRVPDILELAGARFVEIGTTNIVSTDDYSRACGPDTACVLLVHTSNFALRGFASKPDPARIVAAVPPSVPVLVDQGSACFSERIPGETPLRDYLAAGCALVCFSADKLLGGPQAGIVAGRASLVERLAAHPLYRAVRPGKTVYSLLERVLVERLNGANGPTGAALARPLDELRKLARKVRARLPKGAARLVDSEAASGGGTGPDEVFASIGLELVPPSSAAALRKALAKAPVPLVALVRGGFVLVDMAALAGEDPALIAESISWALENSVSLRAMAGRLAPDSAP